MGDRAAVVHVDKHPYCIYRPGSDRRVVCASCSSCYYSYELVVDSRRMLRTRLVASSYVPSTYSSSSVAAASVELAGEKQVERGTSWNPSCD